MRCYYHQLSLFIFFLLGACSSIPNKKISRIEQIQASAASSNYLNNIYYDQNEILLRAVSLIGIPYRLGGNSPEEGFDCSGLINYVFYQTQNYVLPRTVVQLSQQGVRVKNQEIIPGDLVFFKINRKNLSHVGIYVGNQKFIHAPATGGKTRIESLLTYYWASRLDHVRRLNKNHTVAQLP